MLFVASHLASLTLIALTCLLLGETVVWRCTCFADRWERALLALTLGWGLLATGLFFLGLFAGFRRFWVLGFLALIHLGGYPTWQRWRAEFTRWRNPRPHWLPSWTLLGGAVLVVPILWLALYPPTSFDATTYHLPYVEHFIAAGRLTFIPNLRAPVFPQLNELLFVLGFFLRGEVMAHLLQTLALFAVAGLLVLWGTRQGSSRCGLWAAALWLGVPLAVWIGTQAFVDVGLTLQVTAALYAWERWATTRNPEWLVGSGLFAGFAAGSKYLGLFFVAALLGWTAYELVRSGCRGRQLQPLGILAGSALLALAPWYARILYHTGNPVFPFYPELFGGTEWTSPAPASAGAVCIWDTLGQKLKFLVLVPWNAVFARELFHHQAPLTPLYLVLLPLAAPLGLKTPWGRRLLGLSAVYVGFWLTIDHDLRYLLPILPGLHLVLAWGVERWLSWVSPQRQGSTRFTVGVAMILCAPGWLYAGYKLAARGPLPTTPAQREAYLLARVPGYAAIQVLNRMPSAQSAVYGLFAERLNYYADGPYVGDWSGPARYARILAVLADGKALHQELRKLGVCNLLVARSGPPVQLPDDVFFQQNFQPLLKTNDHALYRLLDPACSELASAEPARSKRR